MQQIDLVRHGPVQGPAGLFGQTDIALAEPEPACLHWLAEQPYQRVLSSPLQRCQTTAQLHAARLQLQLETEPLLMEMNFGRWDGMRYSEQHPDWPALCQFWQNPLVHKPPAGETLQDFIQRVVSGFNQHSQWHTGNQLWLLHGGVIRVILGAVLHIPPDHLPWWQQLSVGYGSISRIQRPHAGAPWQLLCMAAPLPPSI
ncbi:histidine phosphatase family protein [Rheinheimera sp.]|uniref:histidine phosphatase family protein n=1 Tax=Rheinheimera sp. TaxID=1869214 RepID=UPI00307DD0EA